MPIHKVPIVQNFALITQGHPEFHQYYTQRSGSTSEEYTSSGTCRTFQATRNPFEVTEDFVEQFNNAVGQEQQSYNEHASQLLSGVKRRAGLSSYGEGNHVELPLAWRELVLLSLCTRQVQNAALDALLMSMDQAPLQPDQIPVLFFLAESVLYSVSAEASAKPNLYIREMKLVKLGYLLFLRLFLFHVSEDLVGFEANAAHLRGSLSALSHCESCYQEFPDILLALHFMLGVGQMIWQSERRDGDVEQQGHSSELQEIAEAGPSAGAGAVQEEAARGPGSVPGAQGYELQPFLWRCLLCWYAAQHSSPQLSQELQQLFQHTDHTLEINWIESSLGLLVLGEAAKSSMACLLALLDLHAMQPEDRATPVNDRDVELERRVWPWHLEHVYCGVLADVCLQSQSAEIQKTALVGRACPRGLRQHGGLLALLTPAADDEDEDEEGLWRLRYSAVQAVVRVCRGGGAGAGLKDAAWLALQQRLTQEHDQRVHTARTLTEALLGTFDTPVQSESVRSSSKSPAPAPVTLQVYPSLISKRLANFLSAVYLPLIPHLLPFPDAHTCTRTKRRLPSKAKPSHRQPSLARKIPLTTPLPAMPKVDTGRQTSRLSPKPTPVDFVTRTETDLKKIIEDQWQKELKIKKVEEEEAEREELSKRQEADEERFKGIMRRRREVLNKDTRPYELASCSNATSS
ncbi:transmembrane protein 232 [Engraulis encrasicolus]|uniref:transmembrane protein 232 n=1 Tax=Engraulis encrasicolus TaxID=184585 RepID=UPI002FD68438